MSNQENSGKTGQQPSPTIPSSFPDDVKVSLAGMGDLLYVQYIVTEELAAQPYAPMYIQDEATGAVCKLVGMPKIGALTSKKTEVGNFGFAVFFNPNNAVTYNSKVTFVAGTYRKEHLLVS
jgi:hypothetical protein